MGVGAVVGAVVGDTVGTALGGSSSPSRQVEMPTAPIAIAAAAATRPPVIQVRRRWDRRTRRTSAGSRVSGTGIGSFSGSRISTGTLASRPGSPASSRTDWAHSGQPGRCRSKATRSSGERAPRT